jgi:hypothetical protein
MLSARSRRLIAIMASIRINNTPPGEAPVAIREAWVGLELPLLHDKPLRYLGSGALTGPRSLLQTLIHLVTLRLTLKTGFVVPSRSAIEILAKTNPAAARWWRENAPHTTRPGRRFLFAPECCERVT